jgi:hypothetical protein
MGWVGNVALMGGIGNAYKVLVRKHEGKRELGMRHSKWEDDIKNGP